MSEPCTHPGLEYQETVTTAWRAEFVGSGDAYAQVHHAEPLFATYTDVWFYCDRCGRHWSRITYDIDGNPTIPKEEL